MDLIRPIGQTQLGLSGGRKFGCCGIGKSDPAPNDLLDFAYDTLLLHFTEANGVLSIAPAAVQKFYTAGVGDVGTGDAGDGFPVTVKKTLGDTNLYTGGALTQTVQGISKLYGMELLPGRPFYNEADTGHRVYAPELDAYCHGRFVAVDLVVPEFIGQDDTWRSLPWWPYYDGARMGAKTTLFRTGDRSFVLVFPETRR